MDTDWNSYLTQLGAHIQDGVVKNFGDAESELLAARDRTILCDLSQYGLFKVTGEDAQTFLQNLLSNDISAVSPSRAQYSSFNSAKGRMLATFLIWQKNADYFLQLHRSLVSTMQKKLTMYVLRSKVKISDASDEMICIGLSGKDANTLAQETFSAVPEAVMDMSHDANASVLRLGMQRLMIVTTPAQATALWSSLKCGSTQAGSSCWDWLNIQAGIPVILPATQEHFVAQMANLDLIDGVSFKKGCYPGQEIVARTQYLGKLKRRMYLAHVASTAKAGDELYSTEMEGQSCGMVANASPAPDGGHDLLAVVQISSHDRHTVHLDSLQGEALQFQRMPYAIPE